MKAILLKIYDLRINYYSKRWTEIMNEMNENLVHCTEKHFRKLMRRNTKIGGKCLDLMDRKKKLLKDLA